MGEMFFERFISGDYLFQILRLSQIFYGFLFLESALWKVVLFGEV